MGKLKLFTITLDNPTGVYSPCDYLQGLVKVELTDKMKMRGIRLHIYGGAEVQWSEGDDEIYAKEPYLNDEVVLFGKASGQRGDNPTLPAGSSTYPFRYRLPLALPSSFESSDAKIRYWIKGIIDKPWKFNRTTTKVFTIAGQLDLKQRPEAMRALRGENEMNLCRLCCKSGPISCRFELDRSGYVPGESIPIKADIINHSNRRICGSRAELIRVVYYFAMERSKTDTSILGEISHGSILPGDSDTWNGDLLPIPPLPPSEPLGSGIIRTAYFLRVLPVGPARQLEIRLELTIGTKPAPPRYGRDQWLLY